MQNKIRKSLHGLGILPLDLCVLRNSGFWSVRAVWVIKPDFLGALTRDFEAPLGVYVSTPCVTQLRQ